MLMRLLVNPRLQHRLFYQDYRSMINGGYLNGYLDPRLMVNLINGQFIFTLNSDFGLKFI